MKNTILVLFMFLVGIIMVQAQDEKAEKSNKVSYVHNVGGFAGASAGYGLSYRYFSDAFGFQVTTTPIIGSDYSHLSLGGMLLYPINDGRITRLYGYLGYHFIYEYDKYDDYYYGSTTEYKYYTNIAGAGLGFEITAGQRVGFNFQFGYAFYHHDADDWNTGFDGGIGVFYKF